MRWRYYLASAVGYLAIGLLIVSEWLFDLGLRIDPEGDDPRPTPVDRERKVLG